MITRFSDILFIDDMDDSNLKARKKGTNHDGEKSEDEKIDFIKGCFSSSTEYTNLLTTFFNASTEIINHSNKYNLIVFDLKLNKWFDNIEFSRSIEQDKYDKLFSDYSKYNIDITRLIQSSDDNKAYKYHGIYLYLLLLSKGYPSERMVIFSGNGDSKEKIKDHIQSEFHALQLNNIFIKPNNSSDYEDDNEDDEEESIDEAVKLDIDKLFFSDKEDEKKANEYYRVRRLVLYAYSYWHDWLKGKEKKEIPFNKVYKLYGNSAVTVDSFEELLDHVEMLFPVLRPDDPEKVYYQAAKSICSFHESTAKLTNIDNNLRIFHSVPRTFRNWSAHNKFKVSSMTTEEFALIFCITLRTYFDVNQIYKNTFDQNILDYEKVFYQGKNVKYSSVAIIKEYESIIDKNISHITNTITISAIQNIKTPIKLWDMIIEYGKDSSSQVPYVNYTLYPLFYYEIIIDCYPLAINSLLFYNTTATYMHKLIHTVSERTKFSNKEEEAKKIYSILSGSDNLVQTLFLRQAFNIIRKNYPGKA